MVGPVCSGAAARACSEGRRTLTRPRFPRAGVCGNTASSSAASLNLVSTTTGRSVPTFEECAGRPFPAGTMAARCNASMTHTADRAASRTPRRRRPATPLIGEGTRVWHLAQVREDARVGRECIIGRGAYVGPGVVVGDRCKIQNHALVYEPAVLEDGAFVGPAVVFTNDSFPRAVTPDGALKSRRGLDRGRGDGARAAPASEPARSASRRSTIGRWAMVGAGVDGHPRRPGLRPGRGLPRPPGPAGSGTPACRWSRPTAPARGAAPPPAARYVETDGGLDRGRRREHPAARIVAGPAGRTAVDVDDFSAALWRARRRRGRRRAAARVVELVPAPHGRRRRAAGPRRQGQQRAARGARALVDAARPGRRGAHDAVAHPLADGGVLAIDDTHGDATWPGWSAAAVRRGVRSARFVGLAGAARPPGHPRAVRPATRTRSTAAAARLVVDAARQRGMPACARSQRVGRPRAGRARPGRWSGGPPAS